MQHDPEDRFYLFESTTAKLCGHMQHIEESGDSIVAVQYQGGPRHWWIVCRKGDGAPAPDHAQVIREAHSNIVALGLEIQTLRDRLRRATPEGAARRGVGDRGQRARAGR